MDNFRLFILTVKKNGLLYDVRHSDFIDADKRLEAWKKIGKQFQISHQDAIERWHIFLDTYVREKKQAYLCTKINSKPVRVKFSKYHKDMAFLDAIIIKNSTQELNDKEIDKMKSIDIEVPVNGGEAVDTNNHGDEDETTQGSQMSDSYDDESAPATTEGAAHNGESCAALFSNFLDRSTASIRHTCNQFAAAQSEPKESTAMLFKSLSLNIINSDLSSSQMMEFQADICDFVYGKISALTKP